MSPLISLVGSRPAPDPPRSSPNDDVTLSLLRVRWGGPQGGVLSRIATAVSFKGEVANNGGSHLGSPTTVPFQTSKTFQI
jgi:hypothetical protein